MAGRLFICDAGFSPLFLRRLAESDVIAERVSHGHDLTPRHLFDSGLHVFVALAGQLALILVDAAHIDGDGRAGARVAMMLTQVKHQAGAGNLHVERKIVAKTMLEIELETEEPEIKF